MIDSSRFSADESIAILLQLLLPTVGRKTALFIVKSFLPFGIPIVKYLLFNFHYHVPLL